MIPTEDIIPIVKKTIAASSKCNTHRGYIGWSSCDNICMDMHALICVLRPQKCVAIWLHLRLLHTFWYLALS